MKKITRFFAYGIFTIFTATLFSCQDSLSDDTSPIVSENSSSTSNGNASEQGSATTANTLAYISLRLGNNSARTILPSSDQENFTNFVLKGTKSGEAETTLGSWATASSMESANIAVATGTWSFALTANCNGSTYSGSTEKEITTGQNTLSFELSLSENGTGTGSFSITLSFTNAENAGSVSHVLATLENTDGESVDSVTQTRLTPTNGSVTFSSTKIPAGTYRARIAFYASTEKDGDFVLATLRELVQISTGLASNATYTIESFNDIYEISYELNGGSFASGTTVGESYSLLSVLPLPQTVTREHYTFDGWYTDSECSDGNEVTSTEGLSGNITVYAKWNPTKYAITYKMNGGTIADEATTEYTVEDAVTLIAPTYNDSEFLGWFTEAACTGEGITGWKIGEKTGDITLYAKWDKIYATNETIVERIKGLACSCKIVASGTFSTELIREINGALKELKSKDSEIFVSLDLSAVTGLTELEDASYKQSSYSFYACSNLAEITLPNTVISIGNGAFEACIWLTNITIPNTVTSIGDSAFYHCGRLTSVTIPDGVTSIGDDAFSWCSLTSVTIPDSVTSIGDDAFNSCRSLTTVTIGNGVTSIGHSAFYGCKSITSITIPDGVTSIVMHAFYDCRGLTSITLPSSVTSIGQEAFYALTGYMPLSTVNYEGSLTDWLKISFNYGYANPCCNGADLYINGEKLTNVEILSTATSIGNYAFYGCKSITSVTIPDSVTTIGSSAFSGCTGLTIVTIPDSVTSIGGFAFNGCSGLVSVTIGNGVASIGASAFAGCSALEEMTIPFVGSSTSATTALFGDIFGTRSYTGGTATKQYYSSSNYLTYYIPSNLKKVTVTGGNLLYGAFYGCSGLTNIMLGIGVTNIGGKAFYGCSGLTEIDFGDSGASIEEKAFEECTALANITASSANEHYASEDGVLLNKDKSQLVYYPMGKTESSYTIPSSVTSIESYAFSACPSLAEVTIPSTVTSIGESAFYNCTSLAKATIHCNISSVLFSGCTSLTNIVIGDEVTSIGEGSLNGCSALEELTIPFVSSIGYIFGTSAYTGGTATKHYYGSSSYSSAYYIPSSLKKVTVTGGNILSGAFSKCSELTSITIPNSVTSIGNCAFYGCSSLTSITIPNSITSIGNYAFQVCSNLTNITVPNSVTSIGFGAFKGCSSLKKMTIPFVGHTVTSKYNDALFCYLFGNDYGSETGDRAADGAYAIPASLKEVVITKATSIQSYAFYNCSSLTSVTIPETVTWVENYAFYGCSGLTTVTIPDKVGGIGDSAFENCTGLTNITIGSGIRTIGKGAFKNCSNLAGAIFKKTDISWWSGSVESSMETNIGKMEYPGSNAKLLTKTYVDKYWTRGY